MNGFRQVEPKELQGNFFRRIGDDWMLIAAEKDGQVNMMTASWGGIGVYWNKPVAYAYIRPQRFTKEFVDAGNTFSLTFYGEEYRKQLHLCGSKSGRDLDKVEACGFQVLHEEGVPFFAQADTALICKSLIAQPLDPACFIHPGLEPAAYPGEDFHTLYIAEIVRALVKE